MKKITLLLALTASVFISTRAQTTNYGTSSGTAGRYGSYFGISAGRASTNEGNSFFGYGSGSKTFGAYNTAIGLRSLFSNLGGDGNVAVGADVLYWNTEGSYNTASGWHSMALNTVGSSNTANGAFALRNNQGSENTANGYSSLMNNSEGYNNVANGSMALFTNTTGIFNTATGYQAMYLCETGLANSAHGTYALSSLKSGEFNSAFGPFAAAFGSPAVVNNTTALGFGATPTASNQVRIGNSSVSSIGGQVSWSTLSDGRFKKDIKEDVAGLQFINQLRPVSYMVDNESINKFLGIPDSISRKLSEAKTAPTRQTGFVAQEVEKVIKKTGYIFHGVEAPQNEKDHYSIRYAEFVVPLVKAVQELTAKVEMQEKVAEEQKKEIDILKQQLKLSGETPNGEIFSKSEVALYQNNPNPFSMDTEISMSLPETTRQATLIVYNMEGKQLKVIPINDRGKASVKIRNNELKAGMYLYTLIVDGLVTDTKRMILTGN